MMLSADLLDEVQRIGALVPGALRCSWEFLKASEDVRAFVFRSPKSEGAHFDPGHGYPLGEGPLFRLDLLLEQDGAKVVPWLVDINLMAGMAGVTGGIHRVYADYADHVWGSGALTGSFDLDGWATGIADRLHGSPADGTTVDYVIRAGHALVPDAQGVVSALQRAGFSARLTPLDELKFTDGKLTTGAGAEVSHVFRQVRAVTKHGGDAAVRRRETQAFESLTDAWRSGAIRMDPGFHMYLESHAWMHFWHDHVFAQTFRSTHGRGDYSFLMSRIPRTMRVYDEELVAPGRFTTRRRQPGDVDGAVLKRADSTGGAGLKMTGWPASAEEKAALEAELSASHHDGLLLQDRVRQSRYTFPFADPGQEPSLVAGPLKLAAYFRGGTCLGAHALLTPDDHESLRPGSALRLLPLFVPVFRSHR
ncbi:hypothetical protein [Streptomyces sp. NPDC060035]|uniref:hypothetical protein n=1 Tax=Streptomyces sp. NPDC060035 TaxID=3347044 RepID=UPI0036B3EBC6